MSVSRIRNGELVYYYVPKYIACTFKARNTFVTVHYMLQYTKYMYMGGDMRVQMCTSCVFVGL